jgi:hypothetical protein
MAASRAMPAPVMPAPTTIRSHGVPGLASAARGRSSGAPFDHGLQGADLGRAPRRRRGLLDEGVGAIVAPSGGHL